MEGLPFFFLWVGGKGFFFSKLCLVWRVNCSLFTFHLDQSTFHASVYILFLRVGGGVNAKSSQVPDVFVKEFPIEIFLPVFFSTPTPAPNICIGSSNPPTSLSQFVAHAACSTSPERETPISVSCLSLLPALFSSLEHLQREQQEEEEEF